MIKDRIFDIGSPFVLIAESEELGFRVARNSIVEARAAVPVTGVPGYLESYGHIPDLSNLTFRLMDES